MQANEIEIWFLPTSMTDAESDALAAVLDAAERAQVQRFRFEHRRRVAIVSRAALRILASRYCGIDPAAIVLETGTHGKLALASRAIELNVSHSGELVALTFGAGAPLGIDVERIRPMHDAVTLARRFFSAEERARVETAMDRDDEFFAIWTAKEAVVKALGHGIGAGLQQFTVPPHPRSLTPVAARKPELEGWLVAEVDAPDGYRAAVATRGGARSVHVHRTTASELLAFA